ncbi:MAG: ABC transporter ATP-binding protein [Planctomycetota bacterium]|nr:ABC transporter ATP-binding protein [Planctomycetota bacterium]
MSHIELDGIGRLFGRGATEVWALRDVHLAAEQGDFLLVKGASGAGKTTLLNLLSGLDAPTHGTIEVAGKDITGLNDKELSRFRNKHIGYVFQAFYLETRRSARENVAVPLVFAGVPAAERAERATRLLERVGLADKVDVPASNLSAGQRQRVALARALVNGPELLLADEPTANLDSKTSREILALIREVHEQEQVTVVLVTHDKEVVFDGARQIWVDDGRITEHERVGSGVEGAQP